MDQFGIIERRTYNMVNLRQLREKVSDSYADQAGA
jgi:hypothetical protein